MTLALKNIWNEIKWILTFAAGSGTLTLIHFDWVLSYNLHILMFVLLCSLCTYTIAMKKIKTVSSKIEEMLFDHEAQRLKTTVATVFSEYKQLEVIDWETSIDHIYELEEDRKRLGVNGHTQKRLEILISKIDLTGQKDQI